MVVARCLAAIVLFCTVQGCATTQAWERESLSRPAMNPDGDLDRVAVRDHVQATREGALGGMGGGGGGCGCN